jgi:hypothetical protein
VGREKLVSEAEDSPGTQRKGKRSQLEAATKQRLLKTEKTVVIFVVTSVCVQ